MRVVIRIAIAGAFLFAASSTLAAQQSLSLESLLSAPFANELSTAPVGGAIAWVLDERGARNIWVAEPPAYRGRKLTSYAADDGQELTSLEWSPDGKTLVFVRGQGANRAGENPNPTSDPAGVEQALWRVALAGGAPVKIGAGSGPSMSPKGDVVAFTRRGQIFTAPLAGGEATQLVHARGGAHSLRWSPDGSRLAFGSARGDHGFVGVYDVVKKAITWIAPTVDQDGSPVWSPDGQRIAFTRIPSSSRLDLFAPVREAEPWSILIANANDGTARTIWRAERGAGSAYRDIVAADQLSWTDGDRIVFPWERDGWTHLYAVSASGGTAALLTPGEFEVEYVSMARDRKSMIYNSNQGDIDRRHIWRVNVAGGAPTTVTTGKGIEWMPSQLDGNRVAYLASNATTTAHAEILDGGAPRALAPETIPSSFPTTALVEPESVVYAAADGMKIHAQLFRPRGARAGEKHPAVIFVHGGSRRQMLLGFNYGFYYHNAYAMNQYMASRGYVVMQINYRSGIGYGMHFREAERYGSTGASEFNDVLGAGLYLRSRADVDPAHIGIWGGSYGGYLTAHALARASDLFSAGVDIHGVHDWNVGIRTFVPTYNKLEDPEKTRLAFESSPMAWVSGWTSPVLVIHGDDDRNVSFSETVALVEKLRAKGIEPEQLVFPDEVHSFLTYKNWLAAYRATSEFFDRKFGVKSAAVGGK